jgi:hypothetical protein
MAENQPQEKEIPCMKMSHTFNVTQTMLDNCCIFGHQIIEKIVNERFGDQND